MRTTSFLGLLIVSALILVGGVQPAGAVIISGIVWIDDGLPGTPATANDGIKQSGESDNTFPGLTYSPIGLTVRALGSDGTIYTPSGTIPAGYPSSSGSFFITVPDGVATYTLQFERPAGYYFVAFHAGGAGSLADSEVPVSFNTTLVNSKGDALGNIFGEVTLTVPAAGVSGNWNAGYTPVPEPTTVALVVFAGVMIVGSAVRKVRSKRTEDLAASLA